MPKDAQDELADSIRSAEVVLPCDHLKPTLDFFVECLGFRLERISPADDPRTALLSGHGVRLLLERGSSVAPGTLRLRCASLDTAPTGRDDWLAPNGTRIELVAETPTVNVAPLERDPVITRATDRADSVVGRAGMLYRDLLPGRAGGRLIGSHIRIDEAGPVPDQVHYHALRFQMIFCLRGWVRLVYEDQGPPFVLAAGDAVLQPPRIRHRVLESSAGLEVLELASPAEHDTLIDHDLELPTGELRPDRDFDGQRFVRFQAQSSPWQPWGCAGFEFQDCGIATATSGLATVRVVRAKGGGAMPLERRDGELLFWYVRAGRLQVQGWSPNSLELRAGDSLTVGTGLKAQLSEASSDLSLIEVVLR